VRVQDAVGSSALPCGWLELESDTFFFFFFVVLRFELRVLHVEPLHQPFFCDGFFQDRVL
jgi:hypothetical protein